METIRPKQLRINSSENKKSLIYLLIKMLPLDSYPGEHSLSTFLGIAQQMFSNKILIKLNLERYGLSKEYFTYS